MLAQDMRRRLPHALDQALRRSAERHQAAGVGSAASATSSWTVPSRKVITRRAAPRPLVVGHAPSASCPGAVQVVSRPMISAVLAVSRLPVGSSASTIAGRLASARAIATRWRWPPESWLGSASARRRQPHQIEQLRARARRSRPLSRLVHRHLDVLARRERRDQVVGLEDEADRAAAEAVQVAHLAQRRAADQHLARGWPVQRAEHVQQSRLARAGRSDDRDELAGAHRQVHAVERPDLGPVAVDLGQAARLDARRTDVCDCASANVAPSDCRWAPAIFIATPTRIAAPRSVCSPARARPGTARRRCRGRAPAR